MTCQDLPYCSRAIKNKFICCKVTEIKSWSSYFCRKSCQTRTDRKTLEAAQLLPSTKRQICCRSVQSFWASWKAKLRVPIPCLFSLRSFIKIRKLWNRLQHVKVLMHKIREDISFHLFGMFTFFFLTVTRSRGKQTQKFQDKEQHHTGKTH